MRQARSFLWLGIFALWPVSASGEGDVIPKEDAYQLSREFSRCAGVFDAVSEFAKASDSNMAEHYHCLANGATVAAAMVASTSIERGKAWQLANNLRASETPYWKTIVLHDGISQQVEDQLNACMELNPLQTKLIEEARRQAYGFSE